ncbi:hypothetical protein Btru_068327 [Bulinus truncatus]|nr:hypothetical protein Btru_068327 [Bulinus truncatus]
MVTCALSKGASLIRGGTVLKGYIQQVYSKKNITSTDAGYYSCSMQLGVLTSASSSFLVVCEPPSRPLLYSSASPVWRGSVYSLRCEDTSTSIYDLKWSYLYQDDILVFQQSVSGGLAWFTEKASLRSAGTYTCSFTNRKGESLRSDPIIIMVTTSAPVVNNVSLTTLNIYGRYPYKHSSDFVDTFSGDPPQYCTLYFEGQKYTECGDCKFDLPHGMSGIYTAEAVNLNGTTPFTSFRNITFHELLVIRLVSNNPPVLECVSSVQGAVIADWTLYDYLEQEDVYIGDVEIESNKSRTSIPLLASYFDSYYSCSTQGYSSAQFMVYFSVSKKPQFSMTKQDAFTRHLGVNRVAAYCTGEGTFISLYRDGVKVSEKPAPNSPFNVFITSGSLAKYSCTVYNNMGESALSEPVYVLGKKPLISTFYHLLRLNVKISKKRDIVYKEWKQTLQFDSVGDRDQGLYVCTANISGQILYADKNYIIAFEVPPSPDIALNSTAMLEQNLVTFCCSTNPLITDVKKSFRVYKDGAFLKITPEEETFTESTLKYQQCYSINIAVSSNVGRYSCTAVNSMGESAPSETVIIGLNISLSSNDSFPAVGKSVILNCDVPDFIGDHEIIWQKDYSQLNRNGRTLLLASLTSVDDGIYLCHCLLGKSEPFLLALLEPLQPTLTFDPDYLNAVNNSFGPEPVDPILTFDPDYAVNSNGVGPVQLKFGAGCAVKLKCFAAHRSIGNVLGLKKNVNSKYSFAIYKNGQLVNMSNDAGNFTFSGLPVGEHLFTCKVNNGLKDSVMSFPLSVIITSKATISSSNMFLNIGRSLTLTCNTENSNAIITWKKNDLTLKETSPMLHFSLLSLQDEGRYSCIQEIGSGIVISSDFFLSCSKASKPIIFTTEETVVQAGTALQIFCVSSSTTSQKSVFYQNSVIVYNSTNGALDDVGNIAFTFSINSTDVSNSGSYTCTVENTSGLSDRSDAVILEVGCHPGYYMTTGSICFPCPYGTYQSAIQQTECTPCPEDLYTLQKGAAFASQCIDIPHENRVYLRIGIVSIPTNFTDYHFKLALKNALTVSFSHLASYVGILFHNITLGTSSADEIIVLASLISATNVTNVFYNQLGTEIYENIYRRPLTFTSAGQLSIIKTMNIFASLNNSKFNINHIDIDECLIQHPVCSNNEECINSVGDMGSFSCNCIDGYEHLNTSSSCSDINECHQSNACHDNHEQCVNYNGGYQCDCIEGYTRATPQDSCTDFNRTQDSMYPYGVSVGDTRLHLEKSYNYYFRDGLITFDNGLPFGTEKHYDVYVSKNGMISVGEKMWFWYWVDPYGLLRYTNGGRVICPFLTDINFDIGSGSEVLYQLYKKSNDPAQPPASNVNPVLSQAAVDVTESFNVSGFDPYYVLVVTWVNVTSSFRQHPYITPGGSLESHRATFQAIIVTDGLTSYLKFMYKYGKFEWPFFTRAFIGYVSDSEYVHFAPPDSFSIPSFDRVIGNTGKYGTWLAQIGEIVNVEQLCENFIIDNQQIISDATFQTHITDVISMIGCPCSVRWMGGLWSLQYVDNTTRCFALNSLATRLFDHPHSKLCCYHFTPSIIKQYPMTFISTPPDAGFFTFYDPNPWSATYRESNLNDINPHRWCCKDANSTRLCQLFYTVRPPTQCKNTTFLISGWAFGDPHITTLDGLKYTFNGWGEYIMAWIPTKNFTLQARTTRATNSVGSEATNGTVYSALAAKEKNSSFQVELSSSKDRLTIYCNGQDYTAAFYADPMFSKMIESSIFLERKDEEDLATLHITFSSGIEIAVAQGVHSRDFEVTMPTSLRGLTSGLLGNFNSKLNDEFQLPNGNILSANLTEKEIYYQFASLWSVTAENTVFIYPAGQSSATFQHPEFTLYSSVI